MTVNPELAHRHVEARAALADAARQAGIAFPFAGVAAISIGPITSKTLRELGWEPAAEASPSDVPGLIEAICRVL